MIHVFVFTLGVLAGGVCVFLFLVNKRKKLAAQEVSQAKLQLELREKRRRLNEKASRLEADQEAFGRHAIAYEELEGENAILKRDLQNIDVNLQKLRLDREVQGENQETLDRRSRDLGTRYLKENIKWIASSLTPNNFVRMKQRLQQVIERCRGIDFHISSEEEAGYHTDLKQEYERIVRLAFEREEQARIKAQIREEQRLEREIERELKQLEMERAAIRAALEKALAEAEDQHSEEVERLRARLAEAEEKSKRAISRAQTTKSGHVYVISNIGSFGKGIFKIGMTRRLEPADRIRELSSASVPFPFDVHMMISSDNAPALENTLHRSLQMHRVNRANPRKEFFRTDVECIRKMVEENHGQVQYVADPEALEYNQTIEMSDEDMEFIGNVYEAVEDEREDFGGDE